jgi:D-alanyl-D-alanine carboxypeptidase (penicillin-binding protein 5/6)
MSSGSRRSRPVPLPPPPSDAGGPRLAQPGLQVAVPAGVPAPPALRATAWIVADLATGNVLAACNAHVPLAPASALKILTAVTLHPRIKPTVQYVARPEDAAIDGTKVGLSPGSVYTVDNLWHGLLMGSGNDTANALAALAGGMPVATGLMTRTARSLGALDTVVANTSGLDAKGQVSSVYDLAIIGRALLRDPRLAALVRTKTYRFPGAGKRLSHGARRTYQIQNHDLLLFRYRGATGIKNGYTTAAGASFVGSATRGGHSYVVALLRTDFESWRLGAALLDWAFAHGTRATPVGVLAAAGAAAEPAPAAGVPAPTAGPSSPGGSAVGIAPGSGAGTAPPRAGEADAGSGAAPGPAVPSMVAAPVAAALRSVPARSRTNWLVAAFVVAVAGGAAVRALATRWPAGGGPGRSAAARRGRRPAPNRTSSARGRPARRGSR